MYHVSAHGTDEHMINVHYFYYYGVGRHLLMFVHHCLGNETALENSVLATAHSVPAEYQRY